MKQKSHEWQLRDDIHLILKIIIVCSLLLLSVRIDLNGLESKRPLQIAWALLWLCILYFLLGGRKHFAQCLKWYHYIQQLLWFLLYAILGAFLFQYIAASFVLLFEHKQQHTATVTYLGEESETSCGGHRSSVHGQYWAFQLDDNGTEFEGFYCNRYFVPNLQSIGIGEGSKICVVWRENQWARKIDFLHTGKCNTH
ncbi:hypothetical protein [Conchiformibius steedae]|uniref:Uncharacterized protein n=1 Tax=Conchiformibius steedae TaxID=153493 RepID=A0A3P2A8H3_9NEIS|nr:hypothetical protein [Conchiformibius steedae]RRD91674.1 hypothetical protein EII21_01230 [Conchiformibius steedae]